MRKLWIIACFACLSVALHAEKKCYIYCELVGTAALLSNKVVVQVDFGQATKWYKGVETIKDSKGKAKKFNSMVDAMNFFGKQGWEFVQAYVVTTNNDNVYHWLLKKEVSCEELTEVVNVQE